MYAADYYGVLFHEISHSTGHESRLNRPMKNRFGDSAYAMEELTAELSSCFIMGRLGIEKNTIQNSAAYLKSWIDCLKADKYAIFTVARAAQNSAEMIYPDDTKKTATTVEE
jgi:antirestriction protein ArdC